MTSEEIRQEAEEHCNEVMCTICENKTCSERKIKCREWRDRCAGYYCGAEPREKRIAELEQKLEQTEEDLADYQFNYPSIKELSKENTELKKKCYKKAVKDYCELEKKNAKLESDFRICEKNADTYYAQLTKAKEIIRDLMSFSVQLCDCRHTVDFEKTREQAEQFLNGDGCPDILCVDCTKEDCIVRKLGLVEK